MQTHGRRPRRERAGPHQQPPAATRKTFASWVTQVGGSRVAAEILGVSRSYIDMIRLGTRSPGLKTAHRIAQHTAGRIPMESWLVSPKRA